MTGYLVDDDDSATAAVRSLGRIERGDCRADVLDRFTADRMVDDYERLFTSIAARPRRSIPGALAGG